MITCRCPGKLMIVGEHAVVYGYPCIVTAVDRYIEVEAGKSKRDIFDTGNVSDRRFLLSALQTFRRVFQIKDTVSLSTKSTIGAYGLGSSAATVVATVQALSELFQLSFTKRQLFDLSFQAVLRVQKKASGFDIASSVYGATSYFDGKTKRVQKVTDNNLPLVIGFSGQKADTITYIEKVFNLYRRNAKHIESIFNQITYEVTKTKKAIEDKNWKIVGKCMNANHSLLQQLGVSTSHLDKLVLQAIDAGAYGAKLSGAGGGDCMIAVIPKEKRDKIETALQKEGAQILKLQTSVRGVTLL